MSQIAVGFLSFIAVTHILVSIVLGTLIALVCYYGQLKRKAIQDTIQKDSAARQKSRGTFVWVIQYSDMLGVCAYCIICTLVSGCVSF